MRSIDKHLGILRGGAMVSPSLNIPAPWGAACAQIVDQLDSTGLPKILVHAVSLLVEFEYSAVFVYHGQASPLPIYDSLSDSSARAGLDNYATSTFVLNPFYTAYQTGLKSGAYRMRDLAPDAFFDQRLPAGVKARPAATEEIGFLTDGWPPGREELCLALELPDRECAEISLSRAPARAGFSKDEVARLNSVIPFLQAVFRYYWRGFRPVSPAGTLDTAADDAFQSFGENVLTPRERQLAQLLLRGHSTHSASLQMGISPTTVKTHRKNLYAKLGIGTHSELFAHFLNSLPNRRLR